MTTTATVPDVEVDESELTERPCRIKPLIGRRKWGKCENPAVAEVLASCACDHVGSRPVPRPPLRDDVDRLPLLHPRRAMTLLRNASLALLATGAALLTVAAVLYRALDEDPLAESFGD